MPQPVIKHLSKKQVSLRHLHYIKAYTENAGKKKKKGTNGKHQALLTLQQHKTQHSLPFPVQVPAAATSPEKSSRTFPTSCFLGRTPSFCCLMQSSTFPSQVSVPGFRAARSQNSCLHFSAPHDPSLTPFCY